MVEEGSWEALQKAKKLVYQYRIRLKPLFLDHDKLREGWVFENHFLGALNSAGLHKLMSPVQLQSVADRYKEVDFKGHAGHKLWKVNYIAFLDDTERVFGEKHLEKQPLKEVENEPSELLDRLRYQRTVKQMDPSKEARVSLLLERLKVDCQLKGIQVKHAFDDAAHAPKLSKIVNHVTTSQFFQGLCKMNLGISASDANLLAEKFGHAEQPDLVNYALFSRIANPTSGSEPFASGLKPTVSALA